jgi:hypothetical protein
LPKQRQYLPVALQKLETMVIASLIPPSAQQWSDLGNLAANILIRAD